MSDDKEQRKKFRRAIIDNDIGLVRELLTPIQSSNNNLFINACKYRDIEAVKHFLADSSVDPSTDNNYAIRMASASGHTEVVRLLLTDCRVDPSDGENYAIRVSSYYGHIEVVRLLLTNCRVDPSADNNWLIYEVIKHEHVELVKLLLQDSRVNASEAKSTNPEVQELLAQWKYHPRMYTQDIYCN